MNIETLFQRLPPNKVFSILEPNQYEQSCLIASSLSSKFVTNLPVLKHGHGRGNELSAKTTATATAMATSATAMATTIVPTTPQTTAPTIVTTNNNKDAVMVSHKKETLLKDLTKKKLCELQEMATSMGLSTKHENNKRKLKSKLIDDVIAHMQA
jgi:hypothetical protein